MRWDLQKGCCLELRGTSTVVRVENFLPRCRIPQGILATASRSPHCLICCPPRPWPRRGEADSSTHPSATVQQLLGRHESGPIP